jgi:hypothetical protein
MKLAKSLFLGSAAALATVAGAHAADLPVKKAAPVAVEYVRVCSTYGSGFFVIPGTESCVKLGGRVRADAVIQERFNRRQDTFGFRARGRMSFDVRTPTPYGLLRTFVRFQIQASSGSVFNGQAGGGAAGAFIGGVAQPGTSVGPVQAAILDQGFIQFGGLTAGRVTSFFSNGDLPTGHMGALRFDDAPDITLFAYTYSLGNGFSVSLSAEDPLARRNASAAFAVAPGVFAPVGTLQYQGARMPDVVGNVKYAGTWGTAQISGAVHEVTDVGTRARRHDEDIGFAVAGYLGVNLPMIAAGDAAWLAVTYTNGATAYINGGQGAGNIGQNIGFDGNNPLFNGQFGGVPFADAAINNRGRMELTEAFSVAGGLRHYWVPNNLRSNLFGSWLHVDTGQGTNFARVGGAFAGTRVGFVDFEEYRVGANLFWSPIGPGFDIGVEVLYKHLSFDDGRGIVIQRANVAGPAGAGRLRRVDEEDAFEGRVRVQRDF